jgi:ubiquinone/menaquinone biosynthesis C-methylase UbiE
MRVRAPARRLGLLALGLAAAAAFFGLGLQRQASLHSLGAHAAALRAFTAAHRATAIAAFAGAYIGVVALSVPGAVFMTIAGGMLFGLWLGAAINIVALTTGAAIVFLLARFIAGDALRARGGAFLNRMADGFSRNAFSAAIPPRRRAAQPPGSAGAGLRRRYQRIAPFYDLLDLPFEYGRYRSLRRAVFNGLGGRLLDAGAGTGRNMPFYPAGAEVVGVDLSPAMLRRARSRRALSPASVRLAEMDISRLAFADALFDAAVATFVFCTMPDELQVPALRELARVVRPGGSIRLLDYTQPRGRMRRLIARMWEPWVGWAFGARFDRPTEPRLAQSGLVLTASRFLVDDRIRLMEARPAGRAPQSGVAPPRSNSA